MKTKLFVALLLTCVNIFTCKSIITNENRQQPLIAEKTIGQVWPQPQQIQSQDTFLVLDPAQFQFVYDGPECETLNGTLDRYHKLIFSPPRMWNQPKVTSNKRHRLWSFHKLRGQLATLNVTLAGACEKWPSLGMDELYSLKIDTADLPQGASLVASAPWGLLRGLETFSQLVYEDRDSGAFLVNSTFILDFPRFAHRGILLDTSRHFVPKHVILENLDAMSYNKFNVFHWHIVDDPSFPYQSKAFPELSEKGAYEPVHHIYSPEDVIEILDYAKRRGIRVVPEFDSPGHSLSWGNGIPDLLTQCYTKDDNDQMIPDGFGPINPIANTTYEFLNTFFQEVADVFADEYVHLGGDEVSFACWESNPDIIQFVNQSNFTGYGQVEAYYITRLLDIVNDAGKSYIIWQEVVDNGVKVKDDTVVEVWMSPQEKELAKVTSMGYETLLAACWYLDYISYGSDWKNYYACDPQHFDGTDAQKELVVGGEACLWGEFVDGTNLMSRMWPRASAAGERLWSNASLVDPQAAESRLEEHRCRMLARGINVEPPNGPGFCDVDYLVTD